MLGRIVIALLERCRSAAEWMNTVGMSEIEELEERTVTLLADIWNRGRRRRRDWGN